MYLFKVYDISTYVHSELAISTTSYHFFHSSQFLWLFGSTLLTLHVTHIVIYVYSYYL